MCYKCNTACQEIKESSSDVSVVPVPACHALRSLLEPGLSVDEQHTGREPVLHVQGHWCHINLYGQLGYHPLSHAHTSYPGLCDQPLDERVRRRSARAASGEHPSIPCRLPCRLTAAYGRLSFWTPDLEEEGPPTQSMTPSAQVLVSRFRSSLA